MDFARDGRRISLALLALAALVLAAGAPGAPRAAAIPSGCWLGKGVHAGTFASGPLKARVTSGTIQLHLTIPVSLQLPVKGAPLTIVAATPSRVTLRYGKAAFVATRVKTLPKPVGQLCG